MRDIHPARSGDDVRDAGIDEELDLVLEPELASLQARNLELVADRLGRQEADSVVEQILLPIS